GRRRDESDVREERERLEHGGGGSMARTVMIYRELPVRRGMSTATIIALHGHGGDLDQLEPLCRVLGQSLEVVMPQAPRPVNPGRILDKPEAYQGYAWYFTHKVGYPEPATFGDCLWQVEQFVYDVLDRQSVERPLFLLGYDQGAVLAVTMAGVVPQSLAGVVAIRGYLPEIGGWSLPVENVAALPVLLVHDPHDAEIPTALVQKTAEDLCRRSATVDLREIPAARRDPLAAAEVLSEWLGAQLGNESSRERGG
ncbi:MAG: alpha/beta hydrolase, partial [bacterium]